MKNPVDEYFAKDLENIEITPSKNLWAEKIAPQVNGREKKPVIWYRVAAAVVVLLTGWFAVNLLLPKQDTVQELDIEKPVVFEAIEVQPANLQNNILEPVENVQVEMQSATQLAEVEETTAPVNEPMVETQVENTVLAQVEPKDVREEPGSEKPKIKVVLSLNTTSQAIASADEPIEERSAVKDYARTQWENVKQGEKLEAPKEKLINWPNIKVEGNPLRGMFAAKGE